MKFSNNLDSFEIEKNKILEEAENAVEEINNKQKSIKTFNKEKELKFSLYGLEPFSIKYNLIKELNERNLTYDDLKNFCEKTFSESNGNRKAYNIIQGLDNDRDFRADTIEIICNFLNIQIFVETKSDDNPNIPQNQLSKKPIHIDIPDNTTNLVKVLIKYINDHNIYYSDLINFCNKKFGVLSIENLRKGYNIIKALKDGNNIRASTIELLCEFLNVDLVIVRSTTQLNGQNT